MNLLGQRYIVKSKDGKITDVTPAFPPTKEKTVSRTRSRTKKVSYVLQVTCDKIPEMNEAEFLQEVRARLFDAKGQLMPPVQFIGIKANDTGYTFPRVSVLRRIEEYIVPGKGEGHGD